MPLPHKSTKLIAFDRYKPIAYEHKTIDLEREAHLEIQKQHRNFV